MKIALSVLAFLSVFAIIGAIDYKDEEVALIEYCDNVRNKIWPDYKGIYKKECKIIVSQSLTN